LSPCFTRLRRNAVQNARSSEGSDVDTQHLPLALRGDADRDDGGLADDAAVDLDLVVRRGDPPIAMLAGQGPRAERRSSCRSLLSTFSRRFIPYEGIVDTNVQWIRPRASGVMHAKRRLA
jgi:hypothetical protein